MGIWPFLKFIYHGSTGIGAQILELISGGINMSEVYNFHTMLLKSVMPQTSATFLNKVKGKNLWWTLKTKLTKHWSQQNWFADVPKSLRMHNWSKSKATKLEKKILS